MVERDPHVRELETFFLNEAGYVHDAPEVAVQADPNRLRQVLVNVLGNAIKYTPRGGSIRLSAATVEAARRSGGTISVEDNGPGIPAEKQQAIFQPYYRLPPAAADAPEGLGLGLAISRELIRQMGGDIDLVSRDGAGCIFTVRQPTAAGPAAERRGLD